VVLNKWVRDRHSPEEIAAAKKLAGIQQRETAEMEPGVAEIFIRDAKKAVAAIGEVTDKTGEYTDDDYRSYIIHTHGMKAALANIKEMKLSAAAKKLEQMGRDKNRETINNDTPPFIEALLNLVKEMEEMTDKPAGEMTEENKPYLFEKLALIKTACDDFDDAAAEEALTRLKGRPWPEDVRQMLENLDEKLLHSEFEEAAAEIEEFEKGIGSAL
jgi:HPt (histidine-containing phosphotransfer) domain-containing protein